MSVDKLVDSTQLDADLTSVANAIRTKGGTSAQLAFPSGFVSAVEAIETGGGGGGPLTKILEFTTTSAVHAIEIPNDTSAWNTYDFLIVRCTLETTAADWIYVNKSSSTGAGSSYTTKASFFDFDLVAGKNEYNGANWRFFLPSANAASSTTIVIKTENIYLIAYTAAVNIKAGATIKIYGGKNVDL